MVFPSYRPLTQHDRKFGLFTMVAGAAHFTVAALSMDTIKTSTNYICSCLTMGFSLLLFFGGISWLLMNSRNFGRPWWKLLNWGGGCGGGATGLSQLVLGNRTLVPIGYGLCAWTVATTVIVFNDGLKDFSDYYHREAHREESIPEYAIGTPRDPAWHGHGRNTRQAGDAGGTASTEPDGRTSEPGFNV